MGILGGLGEMRVFVPLTSALGKGQIAQRDFSV